MILGESESSLVNFKLSSVHGSDFSGIQVNLDEFELSPLHGSDFGVNSS